MDGAAVAENELNVAEFANENEAHLLHVGCDLRCNWRGAGADRQPPPAASTVPVTVDNFTRAESDLYFHSIAVKENAFGKFFHNREPAPIDNQNIIRLNRDTLVFRRGVRSRCRAGDGHAARRRQTLHVDAGDR